MIPQTDRSGQTTSWQEALVRSIRSASDLCEMLNLKPEQLNLSESAAKQFPVKAPLEYLSRIKMGDPKDPLLRQILNLRDEELQITGFSSDPLQESKKNPTPGLIHKYKGRVLLIVSGNCAIHCRYCFRRHFDYDENSPSRKEWQQSLAYIQNDTSITEVILSGGDPLSAPDRHLAWLVDELSKIKHLKRLRIHTRFPVVIPQRINESCLKWMRDTRLVTTVVLHVNHAQELDQAVFEMADRLRSAKITLLNQTVLLRKVNDSAEHLIELSERLHELGILPYYVHLLDKVSGAAHFDVEIAKARQLQEELRKELPGYLLPRLVCETVNDPAKMPLELVSSGYAEHNY